MQRPLERNNPAGVTLGFGGIADEEAASELVEAVQTEDEEGLAAERVAQGEPASQSPTDRHRRFLLSWAQDADEASWWGEPHGGSPHLVRPRGRAPALP